MQEKKKSNLDKFIDANKLSPVVSGRVIGAGGEGAVYVFKDGSVFRLSCDECAAVHVFWDISQ